MSKRFAILISALLLVRLLAGCGAQPAYVPTGDALGEQGASQPGLQPPQPEQDISLVIYPEKTLNPYACADFTNRALFSLIYQGLFTVDRNYEVHPVLCRRFWVSQDQKTYIFYPENAKFADGTYLTAADVAASLEAARTGPVYSGRLQNVQSISQTEDGGVQVALTTPYENLPLLLDIPIVKAAQVAADFPSGTGPYALEHGAAGRFLRLRQDWWCKAKLPISVEKIPLVSALSPQNIRDQFELGSVGAVCTNPGSDSYVDFRSDHELWDCETGIFLYLGCRAKSSVFKNERVRQALTHAIDRETLVLEYYRSFGWAATVPASPNSPYYSVGLAEQYGYDAQVFASVLKEEGLEGKNIVLLVNKADGRRVKAAQAVGEMLRACSLKVTVRALGGDDYVEALVDGSYDLHLGQTMLSPNMDLSAFFRKGGTLDYCGMNNEDVYALCQDALASSGNYTALHRAVMEDGMLCPVAFLSYGVYIQPGLIADFAPARDCIFYYNLEKSMDDIKITE